MTSQQLAGLIPLLVFFVLMYLLFWRPQMVQMRRRREMLAALRPGDRVVTIGGLHATILEVKDDVLVLELAPNVRVRADRTAVQAVRGRVAAMPERAAGGRQDPVRHANRHRPAEVHALRQQAQVSPRELPALRGEHAQGQV